MVKNVLFITALFVMLCGVAFAAEIGATVTTENGNRVYVWEQLNNDDTAGAVQVEGGDYLLFASGTQNTADFELQHDPVDGENMTDVNSNLVSAGGYRYTSATGLGWQPCATLPANGFAAPVFGSAGTNGQDIDFRLVKVATGC